MMSDDTIFQILLQCLSLNCRMGLLDEVVSQQWLDRQELAMNSMTNELTLIPNPSIPQLGTVALLILREGPIGDSLE